jgi:hypothetical protein
VHYLPPTLTQTTLTSQGSSRVAPGKADSFTTASNFCFNFALAYATPPAFRNIMVRIDLLFSYSVRTC